MDIMIPATAMQSALMAQTINRIKRELMPKAMALAWSSEVARMARPQRDRKRKTITSPKVNKDRIPAQIGSDRNRKSPISIVISGRSRKKG